ncbi:MAG: hypothetical protein JWM96_1109 [Alphaproteobacteria bacterium]|nr:hypothetical protein [Alphaproteobacteria bacterium]
MAQNNDFTTPTRTDNPLSHLNSYARSLVESSKRRNTSREYVYKGTVEQFEEGLFGSDEYRNSMGLERASPTYKLKI